MCVSARPSFDDKASLTSSTIGITGMEPWLKISLLLCIFGLIKEFRPSEPFITEYLINPPMNFTMDQVSQDIFPYSIYAYMVALIIVFLVTDYLRYKIVIVLDAISGFVVYMMLIYCRSLFAMQVLEVIYGLFMAGEVAYYTYIYAKVDKKHFQAVTSHTRTAYLVGRSVSGIASQVIVSSHIFSYIHLQMFTAGGLALATFWSLFLPSVDRSVYFHRSGSSSSMASYTYESKDVGACKYFNVEERSCKVLHIMKDDLKHAFSNAYVLKLLLWSVVATGGYFQVLSYSQVLWDVVSRSKGENAEKEILYNGAVECCYTILGALATFSVGKIKLTWCKYSECMLAVNSLLMASMVYWMSQTENLWIAYTTYIIFAIIYQATITIVNSEIAQNLKEDSYGLIFGVAMFFALVGQTLLTVIVVGSYGFALPTRLQFFVYGAYYNVVGVLLLCKVVVSTIMRFCQCDRGSTASISTL